MKEYLFIVNPAAGRGQGSRLAQSFAPMLERNGFQATTALTTRKGEATSLARSSRADVVVAVGGDGTVNEVANGLVDSTRELGIIPVGSGNDLIKSLGIPRDPEEALRLLKTEDGRLIDIGIVVCSFATGGSTHDGNSITRYFVNGMGIGFDAAVARQASEIKYLSGTLLYLTAVLMTLGRYRSPSFKIVGPDSFGSRSRRLLIAIGNGACAGGGFYLTPQARVDDGVLDLCAIDAMSATGILGFVPLVLTGTHLRSRRVTYKQGRNFEVASEEPFPVHTDGEIVGTNVTRVRVAVCGQALRVVYPRTQGSH